LYSYSIKNKNKKKLLQQSNSISNLQLERHQESCFYQNENLQKFDTKQGRSFNLLILNQGRERQRSKTFLNNQQKELFQFVRDQEEKKIGIRKPMKINLIFLNLIFLWKRNF
jgi:hypothetical protein